MMIPPLVRLGMPPYDLTRYIVLVPQRGWLEAQWRNQGMVDINASMPQDLWIDPTKILCWMPQDGT